MTGEVISEASNLVQAKRQAEELDSEEPYHDISQFTIESDETGETWRFDGREWMKD